MDTQALEQFHSRLAQTIFWCAPRADKLNLEADYDIRTIQECWDKHIETIIYTHPLNRGGEVISSRADAL